MQLCECGCGTPVKQKESNFRPGHIMRIRKYPVPTLEERFFRYVRKTRKCWNWIGPMNHGGYGRLSNGRKGGRILAHRYSWEFHKGKIPKEMYVCHHCDNPKCVNPKHLYVGNQSQNMEDAAQRKRMPRGSSHHNARLTIKDIERIYALRKQGKKQHEIATQFGVTNSHVCLILQGKHWAHCFQKR